MILKCKRCGYSWEQKGANKPKTCSGCKSPYWTKELTPYWKSVREKNKKKKLAEFNLNRTLSTGNLCDGLST